MKGKCYPKKGYPIASRSGIDRWEAFRRGEIELSQADSLARLWFDIYGRENLEDLWLTEAYLPIPVMDTLVVLLTVAEQDLFSADDEEDEGGDE